MHDDRLLIEHRLQRIFDHRIRPAVYGPAVDLSVRAWFPPRGEPVHAAEALDPATPYQPFAVGDPWGPPWSTTWFRLEGTIPPAWAADDKCQVEAVIDLGFNPQQPGFSCEGLVYRPDGRILKGLAPQNRYVPVSGPQITLFVEAAANPEIGHSHQPTLLGDPATAGQEPLYRFRKAVLACRQPAVADLVADIEVLFGMAQQLEPTDPRRNQVTRALERMLDRLDPLDVPGTAEEAAKELAGVLAHPAAASAHRISAIGNAHIDSAWLWPLRETRRKVTRTVANALALADSHPEHRFAFSQAAQLQWLKEDQPELFARLAEHVAAGRIVPVGGLWVEPDGNIPSGESYVRQMVYGKRLFLDEFGVETKEVWMPDSFGYTAALPQLARLAGNRWMLTQKLSWNDTNRFPHHSFWWEGIDGTRLFTHFPPVDTYNATMKPAELVHAARTFAEHGRATRSLAPFGYGDGGGGPTREMLARIRREGDLEGLPQVAIETPSDFFEQAEAEYPEAPVWSGELYLELHRGVLTTQARTKAANRRAEHLLHEAELWAATAFVRAGLSYPHDELEELWKAVLLLQFHDILPGTSIAWVHADAERMLAAAAGRLEALIARALAALAGPEPTVFNPAPHAQGGVAAYGYAPAATTQSPEAQTTARPTTVTAAADALILENGLLRVAVSTASCSAGLVTSIHDMVRDREVLAPGAPANLLQLHPDFPSQYDAWDLDRSYRNTVTDLVEADEVVAADDAVRVTRRFRASSVAQTLSLSDGDDGPAALVVDTAVDWHEHERLLKVAVPLDVHAERVASEIPFGHVYRPTHTNTSWDVARFEVAAHRWLHVGEPGYGVAITMPGYGLDTTRSTRPEGGTTTTVRLSLLRGPRYPDPEADQGEHRFSYRVLPGATIGDAVRAGYRAHLPLRTAVGASTMGGGREEGLFAVEGSDGIVVDTVKAADDRSGALVVRMYEAFGGQARGTLRIGFACRAVEEVDLLERPGKVSTGAVGEMHDNRVSLRLRPFQVLSILVSR